MRKIIILSDTHLGLTRKANFTAESSVRRERIAYQLLEDLLASYPQTYPLVCGGDLFDRFSNPERTVLRAYDLLSDGRNVHLLAGNHDVDQRVESCSSLELLGILCEDNPGSQIEVLRNRVAVRTYDQAQLVFVPHCLSQDLFLEALELARQASDPGAILFLHCTYDLSFDTSHTALNLTREMAQSLLLHFRYVLLGHEHVPREDFGGRLRVIGSHYPTAFDNLSDKRHLLLDTQTLELESIVHWRSADYVYRGPADGARPGFDFYDLTDVADSKLPLELFKQGALGVRVPGQETSLGRPDLEAVGVDRLPEQIAKELAEWPERLKLWLELRGRINA
jgi:DNA repair exonuclease SbcCD nuclease subunit